MAAAAAAAAEAARQAALRADRQQRITDRQQRLWDLWQPEMQHDAGLLLRPWEGLAVDMESPFLLDPWITAKGYITEAISKYITARLPKEKRASLEKLMEDVNWCRRDNLFLGYGHDIRPGNDNEGVGLMKSLVKDNADANPQLWAPVKTLLEFLDRLGIMRRFANGRNPELTATPLPDGSNIPRRHHALTTAWTLHRAWIRALHYRTLKIGDDKLGFVHLQDILQLSLGLYALELEDVPFEPQNEQINLARNNQILKMYNQIENALRDLGTLIRFDPRKGRWNTTEYNLEPDWIKAAFQQVTSTLDPKWELWIDILGKAAAFERASDVLHVENVLVEKRVVLEDEWFNLMTDMLNPTYNPSQLDRPAVEERFTDNEETVLAVLQKVSETNRLRRNKLLFTDWNEYGPWKQLYVMYDTSPIGKPHFIKLISDFWGKKDRMRTQYLDREPPGPSNPSNIWSKLFPIHPLASTDPPDDTQLGKYQGLCVICQENFVDTCEYILVRLKCDHWYHFTCIRRMWDHPDSNTFPCPQCRLEPYNWHLHDHAGITPEVRALDVWDYEDLTSFNYIFGTDVNHPPQPDLSNHYHDQDNMQFNTALSFVQGQGYAGATTNRNRVPATEMAVVRRQRRKRNFIRREMLKMAREGFEGLDPEDENAING